MHNTKKDIAITLLLLLLVFLIGCSPKVVSFFFDGVPSSDTLQVASRDSLNADSTGVTIIAAQTSSPRLIPHPPYELKKCSVCHNTSSGKLSQPEPGLCYLCHDDYSLNFKFVHGPVAAGYCTNCHHPHAAENSKLLRRTGQQLCLQCHEAKDIFKKSTHSAIGDAACTACHNPHGGNDKNLLK